MNEGLVLVRTLNGRPISGDEMRGQVFYSEVFERILHEVNNRLKLDVALNDKVKKIS